VLNSYSLSVDRLLTIFKCFSDVNSKSTAEKFKVIAAAYEILKDPVKKAEYLENRSHSFENSRKNHNNTDYAYENRNNSKGNYYLL
jgi:curved DNA-binding protein CbpA